MHSLTLSESQKIHCSMDPMPISDLVSAENFPDFLDLLLRLVNTSITFCKFPSPEIYAIVLPTLKASKDYQKLESYGPV